MSFWAQAKGCKPTGAGQFMPSGFDGVVEVERCVDQHGFKGRAFIVEYKVVTSNKPDVEVGARYSWVQGKLTDPRIGRSAIGEVFGFVGACTGLDAMNDAENAEIAASIDGVCAPGNPLMGCQVRLMTVGKTTQEGKEFTKHIWRGTDGECVPLPKPAADTRPRSPDGKWAWDGNAWVLP